MVVEKQAKTIIPCVGLHQIGFEFLHRWRNIEVYNKLVNFNPLTGTLKPQSNEPLYSNTMIGTLAVNGWAFTSGTARRGLGGLRPRPGPSSLYQM